MSVINSKRKVKSPAPVKDPDGIRPKQAAALKNVSIGTIYNILPLLETWTVVSPGSKRGMRFISRASLDAVMSKMTKEGL
jgi:hypothetical protein